MNLPGWVSRQPLVVERWRLGEDIAEVATLGGRGGGWRLTIYRKRRDAWRREVRTFRTNRAIPATLERLGFEKCVRSPAR
ncbi:MAG TPA: hypothetical protein VFI25_17765 [Planctomycetota bacterium]|jgi:hypothetical protein|nr:hypothetical protein [Planctomycetota bacterium]